MEYTMQLVVDPTNQGIARIEIVRQRMDDDEYVKHLLKLDNKIKDGGKPPYIPCLTLPTLDQTVELFKLCPEQAVPFKVMAHTLMSEGSSKQPAQLKCSILGQAGDSHLLIS